MPEYSRFSQFAVPALLVSAFALFGTGVLFPFFHVTKLWVFESSVSVIGGIVTLFHEREYFLFAVLSLFTVVFPFFKLLVLALSWCERNRNPARVHQLHQLIGSLGKWSMLDVFVVAILIVAMKSAAVAEIHLGVGLYLFTFSVIATQLASTWIARSWGR